MFNGFYCGTTRVTSKDGKSWAGISHWNQQVYPMISHPEKKPMSYEILCCYFYGGENGKKLLSELVSHIIVHGKERALDYFVLFVNSVDDMNDLNIPTECQRYPIRVTLELIDY